MQSTRFIPALIVLLLVSGCAATMETVAALAEELLEEGIMIAPLLIPIAPPDEVN